MIKKYSLIFVAFLCFVLSGFGQTVIFNEAGGGAFPTGWTGTNNVTAQPIDQTLYYLIEAGNPSDIITTPSYNLGAYTSATFEIDIRLYGSGTHRSLLVEVSTDGGANFTQSYTTPVTTTSYVTRTINIPTVSANTVLRLSVNATSGRGIRLQKLILTAFGASGPTITATPTTLTGLDYVETLGPSAEQSFNVEGTLLTDNIILTAPTNFEISTTSGSGFGTTVTLTESGGTVNATTIYTRLIAGLTANTYTGDITATSTGATSQTIALDGTVILSGGSNCNELFISEYVEGSSNNKYIEIYNPTSAAINLSGYSLELYSNGSLTALSTQPLSGTIPAYGTIVYANSAATIYSGTVISTSVCNFNGDDAIALLNGSAYIDIIGTIGEDPGSAWTGAGGRSTENRTIRRNASVQSGVTSNPANDFPTFDSEWEVYNQDDISGLGNHLSDCEVPSPELQLVDEAGIDQNCGYTIDFGTLGSNFGTTDLTFDIENIGTVDLDISSFGIAGANPGDFSVVSPAAPFTVIPGASQTVSVQFAPTGNGTRTAELTINNNDVDESACIVNLTGEGVTPSPEIRVETNSGNNIPNGAGIAPAYNNTFAATIEGQTSASKTYLIENLGTGNLDLSSITVSTTEFVITSNPAPISLAPGDSTPVMIAFSPSTPGVKNATVTINNNDVSPYTFAVRGTGICGSSSMTSTPNSGPVGTVITLTDLSADISTATVALNSTSLSTTVINTHEIEVTVPTGAQTGNLIVTNSFGCSSSFPFSVINNQIGGCEGSATLTDLFISEVTDATLGGLTYVELYNGTGIAVNLSGYSLGIYSNGEASPSNSVNLSGSIAHNATFIVAIGATTNPQTNNSCPINGNGELADLISYVGGINKKENKHDAIRLLKSSGTVVVDEFGVHGSNNWMDSIHTTISGDRGFNFRRLNTASPLPNNNFDDNDWLIIDWAGSGSGSCSTNDYSDIGTYDFSLGTPPTIDIQPNLLSSNCNLTASISVTATEGFAGGNPLAYQWYFSAPGDTGWTIITDGALYSGSITDTLNILDALSLDNYQFYCQVRENTATCYTASNAVRLQVARTIWDGTTWSPTAPNINTIAYISGNYTTGSNGSFSACQLYVDPTFVLTISNNTYVEVQNNIELAGEIHVATSGSLVQVNDLGSITLTNAAARNILSKLTHPLQNWYDYTYWSSPLENAQIQTALADSRANRRFIFRADLFEDLLIENTNTGTFTSGQDDIDDNGFDWENQPTGSMVPGVGYAATHNNSSFTPGQKPYAFDGTLASGGTFNNGVISVPIYVDPAAPYNNWNFIGNPYPSAINAMDFFSHTASFLESVIYFWSHYTNPDPNAPGNQNLNFSKDDYAMLNIVGGVATGHSPATGPSRIPNGYIASGQGFFVIANKSSGTAGSHNQPVFNNAMRVTENNDQFFRTSTNENKIWVNLSSDNGAFNQVLIGYVEGATDDVDGMQFDALRNLSSGTNVVLYSIISNSDKKFAIQAKEPNSLSLDEVIPLGFYTSIDVATLYTLSVQQFEGVFFTENEVFVKDNLLQLVHNLSTLEYSFTSEVGEFNNRFELVFKNSFLSIDDNEISANQVSIIEHANGEIQFTVPSQYEIKAVEIIDLLGRTIYKLKGNSSSETYDLSNLSQATYIAKITLANGYVVSKKAVKRK